ncbi:MAG: hypothetical protein GX761_09875 [Gammaproteobacteria bacterium]|nr:hypothetical protein [Gammaproteobacteria bacterium]
MVRFFGKAAAMAMLLAGAFAAHSQDPTYGDFIYIANADPFTDEDRSFIFTPSTDSGDRTSALTWQCMDDGLNVVYMHGKYLGGDSDDEVLVRYRIDSSEAYGPSYWGMMQNHESTWMPMHEIAGFTRQARAGKTVIFEVVDPLDGERLRDSFSLRGLAQGLAILSCAN